MSKWSRFAGDTRVPSADKSSSTWHGTQAIAQAVKIADEFKLRITNLGLKLVQKVASYGPECFVIDRKLAEQITQNNGKHPHPGSIARVRRSLAAQDVIVCKRIFPGQKISQRARRQSAHGCIRQRLNPKLGFRVVDRHSQDERKAPPDAAAPIYSSAGALRPTPRQRSKPIIKSADYQMFESMAARAQGAVLERETIAEQREDAAMLASVHARGHPP
jgi:hypothetical protein